MKRRAALEHGILQSKRAKPAQNLTQTLTIDKVAHEEKYQINFAQDLQKLLAFSQDADPQHLKQNIKQFRTFLESIESGEDENDQSAKLKLLLHYVQLQKIPRNDEDSTCLASVVQSWSFATQSNNEGLFSVIVDVLAFFLKVISSHVEFREYGNSLCKTLLQENQIRLFARGLNTNKLKEHILSPCLRLLTQIVTYDGGTAAKSLYSYWDVIFKYLDNFLTMRKESAPKLSDNRLRPSIRTNALRFLLANLRLQDQIVKSALLTNTKVSQAIFQDIKLDSPAIIFELLNALEQDVLHDHALSQITKRRFFTDWALGRIATLYDFENNNASESEMINVQALAHSFLLRLCTTADHGILIMPHEGQSQADTDLDREGVPISLSVTIAVQKTRNTPPVKNTLIASFLQGLRPYTNMLQMELLTSAFQAAPELLPDYFQNKKSFSFEPKLTATWVGYSMVLLSTIQLPVHEGNLIEHYRRQSLAPPPVYLIMESILPRPLTQRNLTRCLNQSTSLITFIGIRILIAAFRKLAKFLEFMNEETQTDKKAHRDHWRQIHFELILEFSKRCPNIKHVIEVFRRCVKENEVMKEAVTHLLTMYYKILPPSTLETKLDISIAISDALHDDREIRRTQSNGKNLQALYLLNLLEIAELSPNMRWWHKSETMVLSPFTALLKFYICDHGSLSNARIRTLLNSVVEDTAISKKRSKVSSLDILILSLHNSHDWLALGPLFEFIDSCLLRLIRRPVKYYDDYIGLMTTIKTWVEDYEADLLLFTFMEQWPFLLTSASVSSIENSTRWLARYLEFSLHIGGHMNLLSHIRDRIGNLMADNECFAILTEALRRPANNEMEDKIKKLVEPTHPKFTEQLTIHVSKNDPVLGEAWIVARPPAEDEDHPALRNWIGKGIVDTIRDGNIGQLILCLCSAQQEIRIQAVISLRKIIISLKVSNYSEWRQLYVLLGELIEAVQDDVSTKSLPYFAGVMAARAVLVLDDPLHFMYAKINKFLNKGPRWDLTRLPSYWTDKILLHPPDNDDTHYQEVEWLLETFIDGLRTSGDMEIYRRCHILERLLSLFASSPLPKNCLERIVDLLHRCTFVGGSSTLITRCGLLSWIDFIIKAGKPVISNVQTLKQLALQAYDTSDKSRVDDWSGSAIVTLLDSLSEDPLA